MGSQAPSGASGGMLAWGRGPPRVSEKSRAASAGSWPAAAGSRGRPCHRRTSSIRACVSLGDSRSRQGGLLRDGPGCSSRSRWMVAGLRGPAAPTSCECVQSEQTRRHRCGDSFRTWWLRLPFSRDILRLPTRVGGNEANRGPWSGLSARRAPTGSSRTGRRSFGHQTRSHARWSSKPLRRCTDAPAQAGAGDRRGRPPRCRRRGPCGSSGSPAPAEPAGAAPPRG